MKLSTTGILLFGLTYPGTHFGMSQDVYRYVNGSCVNEAGQEGLNPPQFGQCSDLSGTVLGNFDFQGVDFRGSKFDGASLTSNDFTGADLRDTSMVGVRLLGNTVIRAKFDSADLTGATIKNTSAFRASFRSATMNHVLTETFDCALCDFSGTSLSHVKFNGAVLTDAQLTGVTARDVDFSRADMENALLDGSDFGTSKFVGTNLTGCTTANTVFTGAYFSAATRLPFSREEALERGFLIFFGCAEGAQAQSFDDKMIGCSGTVTYDDRASLCQEGMRVCTAQEWVDRFGGVAPQYNYWTDDSLLWDGQNGDCSVSLDQGNDCGGDPMRVCSPERDDLGNECNWTGCGLETTANQFFGGCVDNKTAGTLCCFD